MTDIQDIEEFLKEAIKEAGAQLDEWDAAVHALLITAGNLEAQGVKRQAILAAMFRLSGILLGLWSRQQENRDETMAAIEKLTRLDWARNDADNWEQPFKGLFSGVKHDDASKH